MIRAIQSAVSHVCGTIRDQAKAHPVVSVALAALAAYGLWKVCSSESQYQQCDVCVIKQSSDLFDGWPELQRIRIQDFCKLDGIERWSTSRFINRENNISYHLSALRFRCAGSPAVKDDLKARVVRIIEEDFVQNDITYTLSLQHPYGTAPLFYFPPLSTASPLPTLIGASVKIFNT